jgi:HD-like signal output (HDOD) protein/CheY-like chemotaxis protein
MANILLLDDNAVAGLALQGILDHGHHRCFVATEPVQAWKMMREIGIIDLLISEVKLSNGGTADFLQRVRDDDYWRELPIAVYTTESDTATVRRFMGLKVQNYLVKPYNPERLFSEVEKATQHPWRDQYFEVAKPFCARRSLTEADLSLRRRNLITAFDKAAVTFPAWAVTRRNQDVFAQINSLLDEAAAAGVLAGVAGLRRLLERATEGNWGAFAESPEWLSFASRLIFCHLNPSYVPAGLDRISPQVQAMEAAERSRWEGVDVEAAPLLDPALVRKQIDGLAGCPVIDTTAAAFQMAATGPNASMSRVNELVRDDPCLSAQILCAANPKHDDEVNDIEDLHTAVSHLGQQKLAALVSSMPTARERHLNVEPFTWANFWLHQMAVGRLAKFICPLLGFEYLSSNASTAGMLQDIGKVILLKLHPFALPAIVRYAREHKVPMADAERKHLGCTTRDLAVHFAETQRLPKVFTNVIRWAEQPELATHDVDLVAIVSVARHVCLHAHIGSSGELPLPGPTAIAATPAWSILSTRLYPSFEVRKFEIQTHAFCLALRPELLGKKQNRSSRVQRAATGL